MNKQNSELKNKILLQTKNQTNKLMLLNNKNLKNNNNKMK